MTNRKELEALFKKHGYKDFKWINPKDIVVSQWVRMKCMFGCPDYGKSACCPPNNPAVSECREFFHEYSTAVILHFEKKVAKPAARHRWSLGVDRGLLKLERDVFLAGYQKALVLFIDSCSFCKDCPGVREECKKPRMARPSADAMAVDVFSTVRKYHFPIEVLTDYSQAMNRYAFLMIE